MVRIVLLIVLILVLLAIGPLVIIWSLNTLFTLGIPYTFKTWAATVILSGLLAVKTKPSSK